MKRGKWWDRIRAAERAAREGNSEPLHELCGELEAMSDELEDLMTKPAEKPKDPPKP